MIDITYDTVWPGLVEILRAANAPYVHIELTNRPFLRAFFKFIEHMGTHDAALIFSDERGTALMNDDFRSRNMSFILYSLSFKEQFEGIYEVLSQYSVRSITYDGISESTAERMLRMRPIPTNYAIHATTQRMAVLLEQASYPNKPDK